MVVFPLRNEYRGSPPTSSPLEQEGTRPSSEDPTRSSSDIFEPRWCPLFLNVSQTCLSIYILFPNWCFPRGLCILFWIWLSDLQCCKRHRLYPSQSLFATDGQSVSMSWCRAPSGAHDQMVVNCLTVTVLSCSCVLSDERSDLSFVGHSLISLSICTWIIYNLHVWHVSYMQCIHKPIPVQARATTAI
jgi:hypothetical protein